MPLSISNDVVLKYTNIYIYIYVRTQFGDEPNGIGFPRKRPRQYNF